MKPATRLALVFVLLCSGVAAWSASASAERLSSREALGAPTGFAPGPLVEALRGPLVITGAPNEFEQVHAAEEAKRYSPQASAARRLSRMAYSHLSAAAARAAATATFPKIINEPAGGTPRLPPGTRILRYTSPTVARVVLPRGKHGLIESIQPMARQTAPGHLTPIDLSLTESGGAYVPVASAFAVRIPKRLADGVQAAERHLSLTPVDTQGVPLAGAEGSLDGASVLYANAQTDTDMIAKPTTAGLELSAVLRAADSPRVLHFRVGMPTGASLAQKDPRSPVQVLDEGITIATVSPPGAQDAAGTPVPVTMTVHGSVLTLEVGGSEHQWPIYVDPGLQSVGDRDLTGPVWPVEPRYENGQWQGGSSWLPIYSSQNFAFTKSYSCGGETYWCQQNFKMQPTGAYSGGEYAGAQYQTKGASTIYKVETGAFGSNSYADVYSYLQFFAYNGTEWYATNSDTLSAGAWYKDENVTLCITASSCEPTASSGYNGNLVRLINIMTETGSAWWEDQLYNTQVWIAQEQPPTATFNTTEEHPQGDRSRQNVLYGGETWLSPSAGAFEVITKDPGLGVSRAVIQELGPGGFHREVPIFKERKCAGVQCNETYRTPITFNPSMTSGEYSFEAYAEDAAELWGYSEHKVKVDGEKPYNLSVNGFPTSGELSAAPHSLTIEATDGTKAAPSSGVKSISVSVDGGQESAIPGTSCAPGECTASGKWTLHAEGLTEGVHRLVVTAIDNVGNVAAKEFTFDVRHATPVSLGPGTVDPTTGQFAMSATDVSLGGASGVSRTYQSRNLTAGAGGPLGPQWAISLGGGQELVTLPSGNAVLVATSGGRTTFTRNTKGEYESPKGDANLKLEAKEAEKGKGISEYLLTDATAATTTQFMQPTGAESAPPTYTSQIGSEAGELKGALSDAIDSSGNVWVADNQDNRIEKFSATGTLLASYGAYGSGAGQFIGPWGIAVNQSNGNVYVTDQGNSRIEELSSSGGFIQAMGWGVKDGNAEFEVCASECKAGLYGSGNGEINVEGGVAVDPSGNVWVADYGNNRIQEFNEKSEFVQKFGSEGAGNGQFKGPLNIASSGGNLYVTDYGNNRVEEFSTSGAFIKTIGETGSGNGQFSSPYGIATDARTGNLYVGDASNNRVQEFTASGVFIAKFGSSGTGAGQFASPTGVAVNASGGVYVVDYANNRLEEWTRATWMPKKAEGPAASGATTYAYQAVEVEGQASIEPTEALAPKPSGVSCPAGKPERGCRVLTFNYAKATTATGENRAEWGDYIGRLTRVYFTAWDPAKNKMSQPITVAQYEYDKQGRLRAEWDPRISTALKTDYGYDEEGHLTAVTAPGMQTWNLTYGTIAGDANTGRLLKVEQEKVWLGKRVENTKAPELSGTAVVGTTMGVSHGTWTGAAAAYGYQWEDCNTERKECSSIAGATNPNYTVSASDVGRLLVASVTGTNGGGSVSATAAASSVTINQFPIEYALPANSRPSGIASGPDGNLWYTDNNTKKIGKITTSGAITEYPLPEIKGSPHGISAGPDGNLWYTVDGPNRIGKITTSGAITEYAILGERYPDEITQGPDGNLWYTVGGKAAIGKIATSDGASTEYPLPAGREPSGITRGPDGNLWFTENPGDKIGKITTSGAITEYSLPNGSCPGGITQGPDGNLWFTDHCTNKIGKITTAGAVTEYAVPAFSSPSHIVQGPDSNLWYTEGSSNRIGKITTSGVVTEYALPASSTTNGIAQGPDGDLWYANNGTETIGKITTSGITSEEGKRYGPEPGWTVEYHVPTSGPGLPELGAKEVKAWGQQDAATEGMAIFPPDEPQAWPATGYKRATIQYLDAEGRTVNSATPSGGVATSEYNELNDVTRTLSADNRAAALKEGSKSAEVAERLDTKSTYQAEGSQLVETLGPQHTVKLASGSETLARNQVKYYYNEGAPSEGGPYSLVTKTTDAAKLVNGEEMDPRTTTTSYSGLGWKLRKPTAVTTDPSGLKLTSTTVYDEGTGNVLETKSPGSSGGGGSGNPEAHAKQTIYYSSEPNEKYKVCGGHAEWANLPCQAQPKAQPGDGQFLPTGTFTYNIWDELETTTEVFGSTTRVKAQTYDAAGRALTSETSASVDTPLPKVTNKFNAKTGALEQQSTTTGGKTQTITSVRNTLGQLTSYTDADGNTTKYSYEIDGRVEEVSDGKGTQSYVYDPTTGYRTKLVDSAAGTFTASYDVEGRMTSEGYPNGMTATYAINSAGKATALEYTKGAHCGESCTWFFDKATPSIHGEMLAQTSSLAKDSYRYDSAARLAQAEEEPVGKGCTGRLYGYDVESNRTSLTTREGPAGKCPTEGGTSEPHSYDTANRLTDTGVAFETFGNTTKLPASDAGKYELSTSYYVDGQAVSQTQNGETINYSYDPAGRTRETVSTGTRSATSISHYPGAGEAVAWTAEGGEAWTRNIPGIDGTLTAIQSSAGTTILQLHDLQGNIVATAGVSETETKLLSTYNSSEFGVPNEGKQPPKYAWLGAGEVSTELSSGVASKGGASYVPQIARDLQTEAVEPPGAFPNGAGSGSPYVAVVSASSLASAQAEATKVFEEIEAARQAAARRKAEEEAANQPPGEVPSPGEGGAEQVVGGAGVDPKGILWWKATDQLADKFVLWAKEIENGISAFLDQSAYGIEGVIEYMDNRVEELYSAAGKLRSCANKVKSESPHGVCWIEYTDAKQGSLGLGLFDDITQFDTKPCSWFEGHTPNHEWFYCPGTREHWYEG